MKMEKIIFIAIPALLYVILIIFANFLETIFSFPWVMKKLNKNDIKVNFKFEDINFDDGNWKNINWVWIDGNSQKTIFYFHGNWEPIQFCYKKLKYFQSLGYNVMAVEYPGYDKATGFPTEKNVNDFSDKFYEYIKNMKKIKDENIVVWAYSIGVAVAIEFLTKHPNIEKSILMAGFASRHEMWKYYCKFNIQKMLFLPNSFNSLEKVKKLENKALFVHWNKDKTVPFSQWKTLFETYKWKKYFLELDWEWHTFNIYHSKLEKIFVDFLTWEKIDFENNKKIIKL